MSWNKNTVSHSEIDAVIRTLREVGYPYELVEIGQVAGNGLNDGPDTMYPIRKLSYGRVVIVEQMVRQTDCDADDAICSYYFTLGQLGSTELPLEILIDSEMGEEYVDTGEEDDAARDAAL